jgi:hypothetical protein
MSDGKNRDYERRFGLDAPIDELNRFLGLRGFAGSVNARCRARSMRRRISSGGSSSAGSGAALGSGAGVFVMPPEIGYQRRPVECRLPEGSASV